MVGCIDVSQSGFKWIPPAVVSWGRVDSCWTMISCDTPFSRCDRQLLRNMHYKDVRQALTPLMCTCFLPETGELVQACYAELSYPFRKSSMHDRQCWWWIISEVWCSTVLRWPRNDMLRRIPASMFLLRRFRYEAVYFLHLFSRISTWSSSAARSAHLLSSFAIRSSEKCWLLKTRTLHESAQSLLGWPVLWQRIGQHPYRLFSLLSKC